MAAIETENIALPAGVQLGHAAMSGTTSGIPSAPAGTAGRGQTTCQTCGRFRVSSGTDADGALDPVQWRATSPYTSFGLDIGGTLCKLVYFEPDVGTGSADGRESFRAGEREGDKSEGGAERGGNVKGEPCK